jgi:hypothetical protein
VDGGETEEVVLQVAVLPILYVIRTFTTWSVLCVQPVSLAGYSNVSLRHLDRCETTFPRSMISCYILSVLVTLLLYLTRVVKR